MCKFVWDIIGLQCRFWQPNCILSCCNWFDWHIEFGHFINRNLNIISDQLSSENTSIQYYMQSILVVRFLFRITLFIYLLCTYVIDAIARRAHDNYILDTITIHFWIGWATRSFVRWLGWFWFASMQLTANSILIQQMIFIYIFTCAHLYSQQVNSRNEQKEKKKKKKNHKWLSCGFGCRKLFFKRNSRNLNDTRVREREMGKNHTKKIIRRTD